VPAPPSSPPLAGRPDGVRRPLEDSIVAAVRRQAGEEASRLRATAVGEADTADAVVGQAGSGSVETPVAANPAAVLGARAAVLQRHLRIFGGCRPATAAATLSPRPPRTREECEGAETRW
jgi:hypothetical protein